MKTATRAVLSLVALVFLAGCDKPSGNPNSITPPPKPGQSGQQGGPLANLADDPHSLLGKSADMARQVVNKSNQSQAAIAAAADQASGQAGTLTISGVEFSYPPEWESVPPANSMQKAALRVAPDNSDGQTLCVWLPGIGGDTQSNLARWRGMVTNPETNQPATCKSETITVAGMTVSIVAMSGTYASMASGTTTQIPGQGFRGAIIEAPTGSIFVRMTGPKAQVDKADAAWRQMIKGIVKK